MSNIMNNFNRVASSYDKFSYVQKRSGSFIINSLLGNSINKKRILDIGSGTGNLTKLLYHKYNPIELHGIDISPEMIKVARNLKNMCKIDYFCCDLLEFLKSEFDNKYDLIFSNMVFQWEQDSLYDIFFNCYKNLSKEGEFVFSIPLIGTFKELLFENININDFFNISKVIELLSQVGFKCIETSKIEYTMNFTNKISRLKSIKNTGANFIIGQRKKNYSQIKNLLVNNEKNCINCSLTYHIGYFKVVK